MKNPTSGFAVWRVKLQKFRELYSFKAYHAIDHNCYDVAFCIKLQLYIKDRKVCQIIISLYTSWLFKKKLHGQLG